MKRYVLLFLSILAAAGQYVLSAENISGPWHGKIDVGGTRLTLVLRFGTDSSGNAACTLDSPDQGALGIPAQVLLLRDDSVSVSVPSLKAAFQGRFVQEGQERRLTGTFSQVWMRFPLTLQPGEPVRNRPQEPHRPYPYRTEEVRFVNESDGVTLAGTLTWPEKFREGMAPVVLMVTGSGTQNRDEEILGHKPFLVLADFLARNGIASLRYDDRGAGESDRGDGPVTTESNMRDALAGMEYLRGLGQFGKAGVLGHSEGGAVAFMLGARKAVDFVVSMAGPGMRGDSILVEQNRLMLAGTGIAPVYVDGYCRVLGGILEMKTEGRVVADPAALVDSLAAALGAEALPSNMTSNLAAVWDALDDPWSMQFIQYSPVEDIARTDCPVMALGGSLDLQVPPANAEGIRRHLPDGKHNIVKIYPGLNHLFQHCKTGTVQEYGVIEETVSPEVLSDIAEWINSL